MRPPGQHVLPNLASQEDVAAAVWNLSHTIIWKVEFGHNSVDFNPEKGQALGRVNNFCPVDGKAKGLQ